jgi:dihydrofolate reductase
VCVYLSMREITVTEFTTLDGVMEAPGGEPSHPHTGWVADFQGEEHMAWKFQEIVATDALLIGRVTYESFAGAWPTYEGPFADKMNSMPKFVVSNTLTEPEWNNTTVLAGDAVDAVRALKETEGGPIQVPGSGTLVHTLLEAGLVDRLTLMTFPVTIGRGMRVFPDSDLKRTFSLESMESFPLGVTVATYRAAS